VYLLTGATGLIGHYVLAELLRRKQRCAVLLRPPLAKSMARLAKLLTALDVSTDDQVACERLLPLEGDLWDTWPEARHLGLTCVVHGAASTRFSLDRDGEPRRTNVEGTARLLEWCSELGVEDLHLVSSAYACGRDRAEVAETLHHSEPTFHNEYERSKWESERLGQEWAGSLGRRLTLYRPSVVVGEYRSGCSTKFSGFYLAARATEFLDRAHAGADALARHNIDLRLRGRPTDCQNIVPVDYVASMIATLVRDRKRWGRVYHLAHPDPPTNALIKESFEAYFGIGGGRFVDPEEFSSHNLNEHERHFRDISRSIEHYFVDTPRFVRANTAEAEQELGIACPTYDRASIHRLVAYAQSAEWGRSREAHSVAGSPVAV